ncbi:putative prophage LambdaBa02, major capsid protein [Lysinibacillus capsici]|uniref:Putative prophage LambdaBa02, major capsid protein n=1 Tax=Lysinibacillus capsici TaxID=2115968 RepID=A0A2X1AAV7_9BACI|nr:phage major capsid protein [Lysinibacillus capsici]SPU37912.1 putative prophage LambdaBa02, major capsid protein [Lysinibacillus capsici]
MPTLYELKQNMATIGQQVAKIDTDLTAKAIDPQATREEIKALQEQKADMQARFDVIKAQHDQMEDEQKAKFAQNPLAQIDDPKQKRTEAFATLVRSTVRNRPVEQEVYAALGDNTSPATGGEKFLPKTVAQEIITEPLVKNPMRDLVTVTSVPNLEIPKLSYTIDDDDFIADTETAKELKLEGSTVTFGRFKSKVFAGVSETVLAGTHTNLVSHVENSLRSGLAAKEKKVQFAATPKAGEEHMSFYSTQNAIKEVEGANLYKAIKAAIADLHEDYRENAKIVMTFADYSEIIETLANGNATLYAAQPEQILGKPVVFVDAATKPIVGDFSYAHLNYDLNVLYETDKDVKTGVNAFVLTAWFDHRIKLKSAFRIAKVTPTP